MIRVTLLLGHFNAEPGKKVLYMYVYICMHKTYIHTYTSIYVYK